MTVLLVEFMSVMNVEEKHKYSGRAGPGGIFARIGLSVRDFSCRRCSKFEVGGAGGAGRARGVNLVSADFVESVGRPPALHCDARDAPTL